MAAAERAAAMPQRKMHAHFILPSTGRGRRRFPQVAAAGACKASVVRHAGRLAKRAPQRLISG